MEAIISSLPPLFVAARPGRSRKTIFPLCGGGGGLALGVIALGRLGSDGGGTKYIAAPLICHPAEKGISDL